MRSTLTDLQRNLLTALNALNSMELIMAPEEESSGGTIPSRHSLATAQLLQQPRHRRTNSHYNGAGEYNNNSYRLC